MAVRAQHTAEGVARVTHVDLDTLKPALQEPTKRISMHERFGPSRAVRPGHFELHELFPATSDEVVVVVPTRKTNRLP